MATKEAAKMLKDQVCVMFEKLNLLARHLIAKEDIEGLNMLSEYVKEFVCVGDRIFELHNKIVDSVMDMIETGESIRMNFKVKLENYMYQCVFDEVTRETYIKKLLRDKEYNQKLLSMKSDNVAIEIDILQEMLDELK